MRAGKISRFAALELLELSTRHVLAACLQNAIPAAERVGIPDAQGAGEVPFGVWLLDWDSATLAGHVAKLLAEEVLGYNATLSSGGSSSSGLRATAGCPQPSRSGRPDCRSGRTFVHHVALEVWENDRTARARSELAQWPELAPEDAGDLGYTATEGAYVLGHLREMAYQAEGLALEYYRAYDAAWTKPWRYFDCHRTFDPAELRPCSSSPLLNGTDVQQYLSVTGDRGGVVENADGTLSARCWDGSWWFAPACRSDPELCAPLVTGAGGELLADFMQRATAFNMSLALAVARTDRQQLRSLALRRKCLPYWWQPDSAFIDLRPTVLSFPPHNALEHSRGVRLSMGDRIRLSKSVHNQLGLQAPRLRTFVLRLSFTLDAINDMLLQKKKLRSNATHEQVACDWVRANEGTWRPWIPLRTECIPGMGLADARGAFAASRANASACVWCAPGRYSAEHRDPQGATYRCAACEPGRSQPGAGQLRCELCEPGSFAEAGRERCEPCPAGTFSSQQGAASCTPCGDVLTGGTTDCPASPGPASCRCPAGTGPNSTSPSAKPSCVKSGQRSSCPGGASFEAAAASRVPAAALAASGVLLAHLA